MRKSRFSDHQVLSILKQAEAGTSVPDLCREHGISGATLYTWAERHEMGIQHFHAGKPQQTLMSSATTVRSARIGSISTCSERLIRSESLRHDGSGPTITNSRIWLWAASRQNRSWLLWPRLYF